MEDFVATYKRAIKEQYEIAKQGENAHFLLNPTSANLRNLCLDILKKDLDATDKQILESFFKFEFGKDNAKIIKREENRFRRFGNFLKQESDLADDIHAADFLALLVDYKNRPYKKFRLRSGIDDTIETKNQSAVNHPNKEIVADAKNIVKIQQKNIISDLLRLKSITKNNILLFSITLISLLFTGYIAKDIYFSNEECMQWQNDHYEIVDCETKIPATIYPIIALDKERINLKKVELKEGMIFFEYGKPLYYYHKQNKNVEFFNGPGLHPVTGKPLKEATMHMINTHALRK